MCAAAGAAGPSLHEIARFFDHLVELVPAKHYYDDDHQHLNPRFLAKAARAAAKEEMKVQGKLNKLAKLDPDQAETALDVQRRKQQAAAGEKQQAGTSGRKGDGALPAAGSQQQRGPGASGAEEQGSAGLQLQLSGASLTRQELLDRLHRKIEVCIHSTPGGGTGAGGGSRPVRPTRPAGTLMLLAIGAFAWSAWLPCHRWHGFMPQCFGVPSPQQSMHCVCAKTLQGW